MNTDVKVYTLDQVVISFAGQLINEGYDENEVVTIEPLEEDFKAKRGADGQTTRSKTNNRGATIKLKLMHTSLANNILNAIRNADLASPNGAGVGVFRVTDLNSGVVLAQADKAWISKPPSAARAKDPSAYEWELEAAVMDFDFSGNPSI
ncbi:MAG TPA: phage protein [Kofleriaceae bacterium]|nr:phage protein [Kofleriaceae bacterium]